MPFKPGQSGNVTGKPRETRNKLTRSFLLALHTSFEAKGVKAIEQVIKDDPAAYLRVIASIMPKELEITNVDKDLSDEQLADVITALRSAIGAGLVREVAEAEGGGKQTKNLQSVH